MEKINKKIGYILIVYLLSTLTVAYTGSEIRVNETVTYDEVPNRVLDGVASHKDSVSTFGVALVKYMYLMILGFIIVIVSIVFWRMKG